MQPIAKLVEISPGNKKLVKINELEVVLINDWGNFFACENYCPHQGSPMLAGIVKNGIISCPRHGWHYDLTTGICAEHPDNILLVFPIEVAGDDIMIKLG